MTSARLTRRTVLSGAAAVTGLLTLGACAGPPAPPVDRLRLATGPAGAVYREMGDALADLWNDAFGRTVVSVVHTEAAVDNAHRLRDAEVDIGFLNVDVAQSEPLPVAAMLRIFDSVVHLLVPAESDIRSLADLAGRPVALGLPDSGTRFICGRLLIAAGVQVDRRDLSQSAGARALREGTVDAMFSLTAMPTPALTELLVADPEGFRFVGLERPLEQLQRDHPGEYLGVTINAGVYPGIEPATGVAVPTLLALREEMDDDLAGFLAATVMQGSDRLRQARPEATQINSRTAVATAPVPLHPGAAEYFRSVKR